MKYTTKVKQAQFVAGVKIEPSGGTLNNEQVEKIKNDPWGKELIKNEFLSLEDVNLSVPKKDEAKTGDVKQESLKPQQEASRQ